MNTKKIIQIVLRMSVIFIATIVLMACGSSKQGEEKEEAYRSIQVYTLDGTATIERSDIGAIKAVENIYLESEDRTSIFEESSMRLRLDDDKFVMAEENTIFTIVAQGTKENSKTSIHVEQGVIINEIDKPLSDGSTYEVTTPNSVMAVRGTVFRVEVLKDESGEIYTYVATCDGKVETRLIMPDGTIQEEPIVIEEGKEVVIFMDENETECVTEVQDIRYEDLPIQSLEFLRDVMEKGTIFRGMDSQKIEGYIEQKQQELSNKENNPVDDVNSDENQSNVEETKDEEKEEQNSDTTQETENETNESDDQKESEENQNIEESETGEEEQTGEEENNSEEPEEETEEAEKTDEEETETPDNIGESSGSGTTGSGGSSSGGSSSGGSGGSSITPTSYTVTFMYDTTVFGTQTVTQGSLATEPLLLPESEGEWDFDFSTPITQNTTINWVVG